MADRVSEWAAAPPDKPGLWWYRLNGSESAVPVEYVPTDRDPLILYHATSTFRWLTDEHFEDAEWRGPVAKRGTSGVWYFTG